MLIADIYQWLMSKYPYFTEANERSWRNRYAFICLPGSKIDDIQVESNNVPARPMSYLKM